MMQLTLEIVSKVLFDADVSRQAKDIGTSLEIVLREFNRQMLTPVQLPLFIPTPANLRFGWAVRQLERTIYGIIQQRRTDQGGSPNDLLSELLAAQDEEESAAEFGRNMSDRQLRDEMMTLLLAGHDTTANALSWCWYLLAQHPDIEAKLIAELDSKLARTR